MERAVLGAELVKVYTSSRWDDLRHLDYHALLEKELYYCGEDILKKTKMTGPGCKVELLPAWIPRAHTLTGRDWMKILIKGIEDDGLAPGKGYFLGDLRTMKAMTYERKITLTRLALKNLNLAMAMKHLDMNEEITDLDIAEGIYMPDDMVNKFTEHGSMGVFVLYGPQLGLSKERLTFLGRWTPKDSVDDYTRESRTAILKL